MPQRAAEFSALAVSRLKQPGIHFVGGVPGLALQVLPSGARTWLLRVVIGSRRRDMGLGGYPGVGLAGWRNPKHAQQSTNTLTTYAYPVMRTMLVRDI